MGRRVRGEAQGAKTESGGSMSPYRSLDPGSGKPFTHIPVDVTIVRTTCGRRWGFAWGYVECGGHGRRYFVFGCRWFMIWI